MISIRNINGSFKHAIGSTSYSRALYQAAKPPVSAKRPQPAGIPGVRWDEEEHAWVGYSDGVEIISARLKEAGIRFKDEVEQRQGSYHPRFKDELREYQIRALDFAVARSHEGVLLALDMRLGKSAVALRAAQATSKQKENRGVIVCHNHIIGVWAWSGPGRPCQIERWWLDQAPPVTVLKGTKLYKEAFEQVSSQGIIVINYDILYAWADEILHWNPDWLIVDECHALQGEHSRRTQAAAKLSSIPHRFFLSGTPMTNRPRDLFAVCNMLTPERFGENFYLFGMRYCDGKKVTIGQGMNAKVVHDFNGRSNEEELHKRLSHFMIRITKAEVATQLPKKTRSVINVRIKKRYRLQVTQDDLKDRKLARRLLDASSDGKLEQGIAHVKGILSEGRSVVVFTYRRLVAEHIANSLATIATKDLVVGMIHGGVSAKRRTETIDACAAAKQVGKQAAFVSTIDTGSTGIDLSFADAVVFLEFSWEPMDLVQAEERPYRFDDPKPISIEYLVGIGTVDELIVKKLMEKLETFDKVVGGADRSMIEDLFGKKSGEEALRSLVAGMVTEEMSCRTRLGSRRGGT